jgi:hypothetical protein
VVSVTFNFLATRLRAGLRGLLGVGAEYGPDTNQ